MSSGTRWDGKMQVRYLKMTNISGHADTIFYPKPYQDAPHSQNGMKAIRRKTPVNVGPLFIMSYLAWICPLRGLLASMLRKKPTNSTGVAAKYMIPWGPAWNNVTRARWFHAATKDAQFRQNMNNLICWLMRGPEVLNTSPLWVKLRSKKFHSQRACESFSSSSLMLIAAWSRWEDLGHARGAFFGPKLDRWTNRKFRRFAARESHEVRTIYVTSNTVDGWKTNKI